MATTTFDPLLLGQKQRRSAADVWKLLRSFPLLPSLILLLLLIAAIFAPWLAPHDPELPVRGARVFQNPVWMEGGSWAVPLGTDFQGRDMFSRLIFGSRVSLTVGVAGTVVAGAIGLLLGVLSGYIGGWVDQVIMSFTDAWLALPSIVLGIFLAMLIGPGTWNVVIILGVVYWTRYARVLRGEVLTLRERDFVRLAQVAGANKWRIAIRHIVPNVMNTLMVLISLTIGVVIIAEASLSFLGVGVSAPTPAWGLMLSEARPTLMAGKWWLTVSPGICIALTVLAANLFGDWMRVKLDPQLRNL